MYPIKPSVKCGLAQTPFIHDFTLEDIYQFEPELATLHPDNKHVKDKIRQQLQVLRNKNYLEFVSRGRYRLI